MENNALSLQPFLVFPIMLRVIKMGRKRNDESTNMAISIVIFLLVNQVDEFVNRLMTELADESVLEQLENVNYSTEEIEKLLKEGEM